VHLIDETNKWKDEVNEVAETCVSGKNNTILLLRRRTRHAVVLKKMNGMSATDYKWHPDIKAEDEE
jgi:hypothetical protein